MFATGLPKVSVFDHEAPVRTRAFPMADPSYSGTIHSRDRMQIHHLPFVSSQDEASAAVEPAEVPDHV